MKIKLGDLEEMVTGLYSIQGKKFPVKISYAIAKNVKKLAEEHADYEKQRIKLCEEFANKDKDGNPILIDGKYDIPDCHLEEFNDAVNELRDTEIDVDIHSVSFPNWTNATQMNVMTYRLHPMFHLWNSC